MGRGRTLQEIALKKNTGSIYRTEGSRGEREPSSIFLEIYGKKHPKYPNLIFNSIKEVKN